MKTESAKLKHSPGPWNLETVKTSIGVCHKIFPLGSNTKIRSACLYDDCYSDRARDLQLLADAHLIAAAPDLLEALKAIRDSANDGRTIPEWLAERLKDADIAIAKAEGAQ